MDFNKLWNNFMDTVTNHFFDTAGRVGRPQFWYFVLVAVLLGVVVQVVAGIVHIYLLADVFGLALLLPYLGMSVRRLQDTGMNGMLAWVCYAVSGAYFVLSILMWLSGPLGLLLYFLSLPLSLVAAVAAIALIYFCAQPGKPEANAFGPVPPEFKPN